MKHGEMTLSDFFRHVYKPVWMVEHPRTWKQEKYTWSQIRVGLGVKAELAVFPVFKEAKRE